MPVAVADSGSAAYGIWPFGVHGGGHASDGHPGWDIEFVPDAMLRAPAAGTVSRVFPDPNGPTLWTLQIEHGSSRYRTNYTNLASLAPGIAAGAAVTAGQPLGTPATITQFMGPRQVTFAMVHFQFDDLEQNAGQTNPFATNPESYLSAAGRAAFEGIWRAAAYMGELCEPFPGNPRGVAFPLTRTWTLESGPLAGRIDFTRRDPTLNQYDYVLRDASGAELERGTAQVDPGAKPFATIEMQPAAGPARLGVWDVVGGAMQLAYANPGAPRPGSLAGASTYSTR